MVSQPLFGLVMGGIGGLFVYNAVKMGRASAQRDTYEPVTAQVRNTELETANPGTHEKGDPGNTGRGQYAPVITYEYTVDGETYTNDNLYPGPGTAGSSDRSEQEEILNNYQEGETVEAYYDPDDPAVAFLEKESRKQQAMGLGVLGSGLLLLGLGLIVGIPL